ncbi:MAG: PASTA domain-containing protein [Coriobacteriia bacterium]|nr:PASTA domain-containing protein [Coriobacteriia bacterium]
MGRKAHGGSRSSRAEAAARALARAERAAARAADSETPSNVAAVAEPTTPSVAPPAAPIPAKSHFPLRFLAWVVLAIVVVLATGTAAVATLGDIGVEVPVLRGLTLDEAQAGLESVALTVGAVTYDATSTEPTWTVVSQSVAGGQVDEGTAIDLVLAGAPPVQVPSVVGVTVDEATALLVASTLSTPTVTLQYNDTVPEGVVIAQEPVADTVVMSGAPVALVASRGLEPAPSDSVKMEAVKKFSGAYSPKSVVATQQGLIFSQNMMYRHNIAVFDAATYEPVKTIPDRVTLADFGYPEYSGSVQGGPVEAAVTPDGKYMYVSQYSMYGPGFSHPGDDDQGPESGADPSFVYRIPADTLEIDQVIKVGSVPKYVAVTPDSRYVLVTNWVSYTMSVIDMAQGREIKTIKLGQHLRGITVNSTSKTAYVAIMGGSDIAKVDLDDFSVTWIKGVGSAPRHLVISPDDRYLYATLNGSGQVIKIDLTTDKVVGRINTGSQPRSMAIAEDGRSLYVVNYESDSVSKVRAEDMTEMQEIKVGHHPIGITYVNDSREIWVSCYAGSFHIFRDPVQ